MTYENMKDSGIPWIGDVPCNWILSRMSSLYMLRSEKVSDKDYSPLSVTMKGILPQLDTVAKTEDGDNRKLVKAGDFVINSRSDRRGSCGISAYDGSVSLINIVLIPRNKMNPDYYNWIFHSELFADEFYKWGHGIVDDLWTTRWQEMKQIIVPVPPLQKQAEIADYLEKRCAEIDAIISNAKSSIEDYRRWKASMIHQAVTKGLDPNADMRESGIPWIGKIPAYWNVIKAKYCVTITHGSDPESEGDTPVYGSGSGSFKTCGEYKEGPAVLIGRKGATLHIPHFIEGRYWNADTAFDVKAKKGFSLKYFYYSACCFDYKYYISQTTLPGMTQSSYANMKIPVPPAQEQNHIVDFLDMQCAQIDAVISEKESFIAELEAYKKSLIYETVTGKRKAE